MKKNLIIIGGGMGPLASNMMQDIICDLQKDIISNDTDYISTVHISMPEIIPDRSDFLDNKTQENPGIFLADLMNRSYSSYKDLFENIYALVPCNTFHHKRILQPFLQELNSNLIQMNIIQIILDLLQQKNKNNTIGVLSTLQTHNYRIYLEKIEVDFNTVQLREQEALEMHGIIRNDIKMGEIKRGVQNTVRFVENNMKDAKIIILGCTEFGIIRKQLEKAFPQKIFMDPMLESAKKIISLIND